MMRHTSYSVIENNYDERDISSFNADTVIAFHYINVLSILDNYVSLKRLCYFVIYALMKSFTYKFV
jgi:hypothetical protein